MFSILSGLLSHRVRRIIGVILAMIALLMFASAILATFTSLNLRANGVRTNATILNVSTNFSRQSANTYSDLVQFATPDGKQHQVSINGVRGGRVGGAVAVVYDPSDPGTVQEASSLSGLWWITPVTLVLFASVFGWLSWRLWRIRDVVHPG